MAAMTSTESVGSTRLADEGALLMRSEPRVSTSRRRPPGGGVNIGRPGAAQIHLKSYRSIFAGWASGFLATLVSTSSFSGFTRCSEPVELTDGQTTVDS